MCNLVTLNSTVDEVASYFKSRRPQATNASPGDVYPGGQGFVVRQDGGERVLQAMTWGFPVRLKHMKPTSKPKPVNNARNDKLMSFWRPWFTNPVHRCLIPFTSFAEAEGEKGKMTRTWISVTDQPLAAWAGLWRPTDEWGDCYTGVMVDATEELFHIHDRMPVILHPEDHDAWLHAPAEEAMASPSSAPKCPGSAARRRPRTHRRCSDKPPCSTGIDPETGPIVGTGAFTPIISLLHLAHRSIAMRRAAGTAVGQGVRTRRKFPRSPAPKWKRFAAIVGADRRRAGRERAGGR